MGGRGVLVGDQVLSAGGKIVEDVLLVSQVTFLVPFFSVFTPATNVGGHIDAALVEPGAGGRSREIRLLVHPVAAVTVEYRGIAAVKLGAFAAKYVERHAGAILGNGEFADHFGIVEIEGSNLGKRGADGFSAGRVKAIPGGGLKISGGQEQYIAGVDGNHSADSRDRRQRRRR